MTQKRKKAHGFGYDRQTEVVSSTYNNHRLPFTYYSEYLLLNTYLFQTLTTLVNSSVCTVVYPSTYEYPVRKSEY
jgi:hypothetical protein